MAVTKIGPHIYVLGEDEEPDGPVKIGMHDGSASTTGAPGMSRGNWRTLRVLHRMPLELRDLRWSEWLIHRRLWTRHRKGEWFDVRDLVNDDDWQRFLHDVLAARIHGLDDWKLSVPGHELVQGAYDLVGLVADLAGRSDQSVNCFVTCERWFRQP